VDSEDTVYFEENVWYHGEVNIWKEKDGFLEHINENGITTFFFFHGSNVNSTDKKVFLRKNMEVRFKVKRGEDGKNDSAINVETRDGKPLNFHAKHGANDVYDREILDDGRFFKGTVKFFNHNRSHGHIEAAQGELQSVGFTIGDIGPVYFKEIDIDAADFPVKIDQGDKVQFQIFTSSQGWGGMNVQMANGEQMPQFTEEDRKPKRKKASKDRRQRKRKNAKQDNNTTDNKQE